MERARLGAPGGPSGPRASETPAIHRFTHTGPIDTDALEVPFVPDEDVQIIGARIDVAAGSAAATVAIKVNGTVIDTVSWSGAGSQAITLDEQLAADDDVLTVAFTDGDGSAAVSIRFEMVLA